MSMHVIDCLDVKDICMHLIIIDTSICLQENDINWNISWPLATRGEVVKQKCPGGAESLGIDYVCLVPTFISMHLCMSLVGLIHINANLIVVLGLALRSCDGDPAVWDAPNIENCSTVEITRIKEEVNDLLAIFLASQNPNNSDRTIMIESNAVQSITSDLAIATDKNDTAILPNDLENIIDIVGDILRYFVTE